MRIWISYSNTFIYHLIEFSFVLNIYWCFIRYLWIEIEFQHKVLHLAGVIILRKQIRGIAVRKHNLRNQTSWVSLCPYIDSLWGREKTEFHVRNPTLHFGRLITLYFLGSKNKQSVFLQRYMTLPIGIGQCN